MTAAGRSLEGVGGIFKDRPRPTPDVAAFVLMAGLMSLGAVMVYSATYVRLEADTGDPGAAMKRQMIFAGAATRMEDGTERTGAETGRPRLTGRGRPVRKAPSGPGAARHRSAPRA